MIDNILGSHYKVSVGCWTKAVEIATFQIYNLLFGAHAGEKITYLHYTLDIEKK